MHTKALLGLVLVFPIVFVHKNVAVSLAKTKIYCCNIAVISEHSVSGQRVTFCTFYLEEFGPEKQKSNNM